MKRYSTLLAVFTAFLAALLVVPLGTAHAAPATSQKLTVGDATATIAPNGGQATIALRDGTFVKNAAKNEIYVRNGNGQITEIIPMGSAKSTVSADAKSVVLTGAPQAHSVAKQDVAKKKKLTKPQAWDRMVYQLNKDLNCAAPAIIVGAIIGLFFIVGWIIGGLIGAFVGYSNCSNGKAIRDIQTWINTP